MRLLLHLRAIFCAALLALPVKGAAAAEPAVGIPDLQAAMRALGFLDSLPHDGTIFVGVVYGTSIPDGKAAAEQIVGELNTMEGPNSKIVHAEAIPLEGLSQSQGRLDVLFLMPGSSSTSSRVGEFIRRRRIVSISDDPACIGAGCCVLMVRAEGTVEIVLDTALADSVGARFSTVFAMMVKRK
jgi:hypothetical protein